MSLSMIIVSGGEPVTVEIDIDGRIVFHDYDIEYDIAMVEFGEPCSNAYLFYKTWQDLGLPGILGTNFVEEPLISISHNWTLRFLDALKKQGIVEFAKTTEEQSYVFDSLIIAAEKIMYEEASNLVVKTIARTMGRERFCKTIASKLKNLIDTGSRIWATPILIQRYKLNSKIKIEVLKHRRFYSRKYATETHVFDYRLSICDIIVAEWKEKIKRLVRHPLRAGGMFVIEVQQDEHDPKSDRIETLLIDLGLFEEFRELYGKYILDLPPEVPRSYRVGNFKTIIFELIGYRRVGKGGKKYKPVYSIDIKNFKTLKDAKDYVEIAKGAIRRDGAANRRQYAYVFKKRQRSTKKWTFTGERLLDISGIKEMLERWEPMGPAEIINA